MATEYLKFAYAPSATIYFAIWDASGNVFDTADDTFESVGTATTPGIAATERTGPGGSAKSEYRASVDLADVTDAKVPECTVAVYLQAGGSPAPSTDLMLGVTDLASSGTDALVRLNTETFAQPAQGDPPATTTIFGMLRYLYKHWRNKKAQTSDTFSVFNDAGDTVDHKCTVSDDDTTTTFGEMGTGA